MTEQEGSGPRVPEDRLIQHLVSDPAAVPGVRALAGFLGKSTRDGCWRLYLSPDLSDYLEIPEEAILHHKPLDAQQSALGGTIIWIKEGTRIVHTRDESRGTQADPQQSIDAVQANFLRGNIAGSFLEQAAIRTIAGGGGVNVYYPRTYDLVCGFYTIRPACRTLAACRLL